MEKGSGICGPGEKAYDTFPIEMVMATVRWMGVPEAEAIMVEAMYERTKGRGVVGSGLSEEFTINIGLRQGSALSPLLLIMVMEIISTKDILRKMIYADDLAIIPESKQDLQEVLEEWKGVFEKHGLRMSLEKTEVRWVGHQREELNMRLDGKEIKQVDGFVYLGGMVTEDGHSAAEVRRRTQAGANAWRKVEGVMLDRQISKKLKGKVLRTCVTPACICGLETVALTEQQQQKLHVCENNWVRRITSTKSVDRRRMNDLRKEVGIQCSLTGRLVRSRMRWAGHLVRMDTSKLAKRAEVEKHQRRRKRGRPQLRWEDCVRRDMRMTEGERGLPIENYGNKEQKEWLDNTLPDPHPGLFDLNH